MIGERLSHYDIISKLGAGGMGEVYLAEDTGLDRRVAIKFLPSESVADEQAKKRLIREAKAAATLDHPNICAIYEVGEDDGRSFIVMQHVEGETLASRIRRKPLELGEVLDVAVQVSDALAEAHSRGIIHRDIKPQNVMLTARGQAKVMDFGLAKVVAGRDGFESEAETQSLLTEPGVIVGTVPYMSPEQVRGEALDARSDIFSFGAVLYEMISGRHPFQAESTGATMSSILTKEPVPLARYASDVPDELQRIVRKALSKDKDGRYQGSKDLLIDLRELKHELEFEAKLERSIGPEVRDGATTAERAGTGEQTEAHTRMSAQRKPDLHLEIAHVLFMDVVGFSNFLINDQSEILGELNRIVRKTPHFREAEAAGKLIRLSTGDGMALVFSNSAEAPVECALEISKALQSYPQIQLRMGVHSGPVNAISDVNDRSNVTGAGINMAQRVMDCGDAGHILLSRHVAEDLLQYRQWQPRLHDLGECEVKHGARVHVVNLYTEDLGNSELPEKLRGRKQRRRAAVAPAQAVPLRRRSALIAALVLSVAVLVIGFWIFFHRAPPKSTSTPAAPTASAVTSIPEKSIAVLPFLDLSQAKNQEYFCDGISEEILDALAKIEGLRVVARRSSFSFKGKNADVSEVANKLNVQNVLEGSVRRDGNRIRITAQLINARDGFQLWSDTYERELQDVFALQDEITRAIVDALKIKLAISSPPRDRRDIEAYDLYLQGLYLSNKSSEVDLRKALTSFEHALKRDPNLARAWTGIAKVWWWLSDAYVKPLEAYPALKAAALKAIALDEKDAEAHCYLGEAKRMLNRDLAGEETELKRALEIDPSSAIAHLCFGLLRSTQGELQQAVVEMQAAEKLDPLSPSIRNFASRMYLAIDRVDAAVAEAERTLQLDPSYLYLDPTLATAYREKGDFAEAVKLYEKAQEAAQFPSSGLAITYARTGRQEDALQILRQLIDRARVQYVAADSIAAVYVALGENDEAFRWLERAFSEHSESLDIFAFHREFRPLRSDPRFPHLLRRIGVVDPAKALARQNKP